MAPRRRGGSSRRPTAGAVLAPCLAAALLSTSTQGCRSETAPVGPTATTPTGAGGTGGAGAGGSAPATTASLLTWNLETFPLTSETAGLVSDVLGTEAPDVVAVQDISDPAAFLSLADGLADYEGILNDDPGAFLRVGVLYRPERVELSDVQTLFRADWYAFPRPPLQVHATVAPGSSAPIDFLLLVVHLKAQLDEESRQRREAACEALDDWIRLQLASGSEQDFVVAGDWNDELTDETIWNVFDRFLDAPEDYTFLTLPLEQAGEHTYIPFDSFIDHILVTQDALAEYGSGTTEVLRLEAEVPNYETRVSDHRPVLARFAPVP